MQAENGNIFLIVTHITVFLGTLWIRDSNLKMEGHLKLRLQSILQLKAGQSSAAGSSLIYFLQYYYLLNSFHTVVSFILFYFKQLQNGKKTLINNISWFHVNWPISIESFLRKGVWDLSIKKSFTTELPFCAYLDIKLQNISSRV